MPERHRVFLLPGFFGFTHLGEIVYFGHVRDFLVEELARRGADAEVIPLVTAPTASIVARARGALETIRAHVGESGPLHLVGHSTGGLDARLLVSPGSDLGEGVPSGLLERIRSVVTVATPHKGTPLASFFVGMAGQQVLKLLSAFTAAVLRQRELPLRYVFRLIGAFLRADDWFSSKRTLLDQLFGDLLSDFSAQRRAQLTEFFERVGRDQALMTQLTPDAMELFHATTRDRPSVRYGSVVTCAPRPSVRSRVQAGWSPYGQLTLTLFGILYTLAGRASEKPLQLAAEHEQALRSGYGVVPARDESDGIIPTLSQPYGRVLAAVRADHLDAIGHFDAPEHRPPHYDWLVSASAFSRPDFERVWRAVVDFLLAG